MLKTAGLYDIGILLDEIADSSRQADGKGIELLKDAGEKITPGVKKAREGAEDILGR